MFIEKNNALCATFVFTNFVEAFAFMTKIALIAEKADHHPTLINTYNSVEIRLSTHDAGNIITEKDVSLSESIIFLYHNWWYEKK